MRKLMIFPSSFLAGSLAVIAFRMGSEGNPWLGFFILALAILPFLNVMFWARISFVEVLVVPPQGGDDEAHHGDNPPL